MPKVAGAYVHPGQPGLACDYAVFVRLRLRRSQIAMPPNAVKCGLRLQMTR